MTTQLQLDSNREFQPSGNTDTSPQAPSAPSSGGDDAAYKRVTRVYVGSSAVEGVDDVQGGPNRWTSEDLYADRQDGSLLATARSPGGNPTTRLLY